MDVKAELVPYLVAWVVGMAVLFWNIWRTRAAGLALGYCFQMWLLYWIGALIHALPWSFLPDGGMVLLGFEQASIAMGGFAAGCMLIAPLLAGRLRTRSAAVPDPILPAAYVVAGTISFAVIFPLLSRLPSLTSLSLVGTQLFVVGLCLGCWMSWIERRRTALLFWLLAGCVMPVSTMVSMGFLGYGIIALSVVVIFVGQFFRPRWVLAAGFLVAAFLGLSLYVNYMRSRASIRESVWSGDSRSGRIDAVRGAFAGSEWFDPANPTHLEAIDIRLNQNSLVGAAVNHLETTDDFARGETIWMGVIAVVPRVLWREKPVYAGSMKLASRFTGMEFAEGTSIGIGPVMELYANFGSYGVLIGFLVIGAAVGSVDRIAGSLLRLGRWNEFAMWFLVGLAMLNVSGSFVEVGAGTAAAVVGGLLVRWALNHYQAGPRLAPYARPQWQRR